MVFSLVIPSSRITEELSISRSSFCHVPAWSSGEKKEHFSCFKIAMRNFKGYPVTFANIIHKSIKCKWNGKYLLEHLASYQPRRWPEFCFMVRAWLFRPLFPEAFTLWLSLEVKLNEYRITPPQRDWFFRFPKQTCMLTRMPLRSQAGMLQAIPCRSLGRRHWWASVPKHRVPAPSQRLPACAVGRNVAHRCVRSLFVPLHHVLLIILMSILHQRSMIGT